MAQLRDDIIRIMEDANSRATRRPFERMHRIHKAILSGGLPNCTSLAAELEVTPKTVMRDITFMRDNFRLPLEYDGTRHGYFYSAPVTDFPQFEIGEEEIAALFLARHALESIRGTQLAEKLRGAFARLSQSLGARIELRWEDVDAAFSRKVPEMRAKDVKVFGQLADAVVTQREVSFHYRKLEADVSESRRVQPLHLGEVEGAWYLIAHDTDRKELRTFALARLSRLKVSATRFHRPADFDGREYLRKSFGVWSAKADAEMQTVIVRLTGYAARMAEERRWHPTQEVRALDAKSRKVEVRFEVGALEEVLRWVLSFGSKAEVVGPPALKKMVAEELRLMRG
ncbi:MAG: WYL domain-containing protein [Akkermansiaceae bacterium]|nr:WYL domain-containing protein [Akkermansiaceae bacterium]